MRAMRVLILIDDLGGQPASPSVLVRSLRSEGHDVHVIAKALGDGSVVAERVPEYPPMIPSWDQISGALHAGLGMLERGIAILDRRGVDVIHAHDWRTAYPAVALHRAFAVPLVTTLHEVPATADGRGEELIGQTARWLASESTRMIVGSASVRKVIVETIGVEAARIDLVAARAQGAARLVVDVYRRAIAEASSSWRARLHGAPVRSSRG